MAFEIGNIVKVTGGFEAILPGHYVVEHLLNDHTAILANPPEGVSPIIDFEFLAEVSHRDD